MSSWTVFPVVGKTPIVPWGSLGAGEKVQGPEGCSYGVATGARSGFFVVDIDRKNGIDGLANLALLGELPDTYTVSTPSGGFHLYFAQPDFTVSNSKSKLTPGVDIRGDGGQVVMADGVKYRVIRDSQIANAPQWLLNHPALRGGSSHRNDAGSNAPEAISDDELSTIREQVVEYLRTTEPAIEGQGGSEKLWNVALKLVRGWRISAETSVSLILEHYNPRCEPPWSETEVWHKVEDARDKSDRMPGVATDSFKQMVDRLTLPPAFRNVRTEPELTRRIKDPKHTYRFSPGSMPSADDPRKADANELTGVLLRHDDWHGVLQWDEFRGRVWAVNPPLRMDAETDAKMSDSDVAAVRMWFQSQGLACSRDDLREALEHAARHLPFHPVIDYLESCREKRLPGILDHVTGKILNTADRYANDFLKKFMIAAVRRVYRPGCQADNMLVLQGAEEGEGKTSFGRILFGEEFYRANMPDLLSRDALAGLRSFWGVEFGELDRLLREEPSTVKDFLSRKVDTYRKAYGHEDQNVPRACVFIGNVNDREFIRGSGRDRRFWPISVGEIDRTLLAECRDAMWGEALYLAEAGEPHYYSFHEERQLLEVREQFRIHDPWYDAIEMYLRGEKMVTVQQVYEGAVARGATDISRFSRKEQVRVADTLIQLGCTSVRTGHGGQRMWKVPDALSCLKKPTIAERILGKPAVS